MTLWNARYFIIHIILLTKIISISRIYRVFTNEWCSLKKLTRNLILTLHGQNVHRQQRKLSSSSLARAYCRAAGPVSKMASQQEKAFCVLRFEVSRSVITVHGLEKTHHAWCVFSKPCTKLTLHCNHRSGHPKTEHTESLFLLRRHLGNWPRSKHEKRTAGSAWETLTVAAADGVRFARVRWEINFLLTFETAPFICKHPVYPPFRPAS